MEIRRARFPAQAPVGEQRREILERHLVAGLFRILLVDAVHAQQGEEAFLLLGRADFALDKVAGAQSKAADLRRRDVDVSGQGR